MKIQPARAVFGVFGVFAPDTNVVWASTELISFSFK